MQENDHPTELEKAAEGRSRPAKLQIIDAKLRPRWRRGARNKRKRGGEKRMLPLHAVAATHPATKEGKDLEGEKGRRRGRIEPFILPQNSLRPSRPSPLSALLCGFSSFHCPSGASGGGRDDEALVSIGTDRMRGRMSRTVGGARKDETQVQQKMEVRHFRLGLKGRDLRQNHRRPQGRSQHTMERVIGSVKYVRSLSRAVSGCRGQKLALGARSLSAPWQ